MFTRKTISLVTGLTLASLTAVTARAAPAVSGVSGSLTGGQSVTLSGSGFGSKAQPQPMLWDDFEGGTVGQLIQNVAARIGRWDSGAGSENVTYSDVRPRTGSKSSYHNFMTAYNASLARNLPFTRLYMDFWIMADYVDQKSRNFKPWRLYGDNDSLQLDYVWLCSSQLMNRVQDSAGWSVGDWSSTGYSDGKWMHIQLVYQQSTPGVADGTIRYFIDSEPTALNSGAVVTEMQSAQFDQIRIGHYWDQAAVDNCPSNSGARVYVDDVYLDTSWARVELGNASTYAASTHRETQVATVWSDGSVGFTFNPGTFAAGTQVYVYVTDANNNTSPGYAITVGGQAQSQSVSSPPPSPPNPPSNVQVQ